MRARRSALGAEAPAALLPWDTEFWGVRIGRVGSGTMTPELLREASVRFEQYAFQEVRHD